MSLIGGERALFCDWLMSCQGWGSISSLLLLGSGAGGAVSFFQSLESCGVVSNCAMRKPLFQGAV